MRRLSFRPRLEEVESRVNPAPVTATVTGHLVNTSLPTATGVPVTLSGTSGGGIAVNATATTNSTGAYEFDNVLPGTYTLAAGNSSGASSSSTAAVTVVAGTNVTQDITYVAAGSQGPVSLRLVLNTPVKNTPTFGAGGTGTALAASRADSAPVAVQIATKTVAANAAAETFSLADKFTDVDTTNSSVTFNVLNAGVAQQLKVTLLDTMAPVTVANFLDYVEAGDYTSALFTRNAANFVLQGGGAKTSDDGQSITPTTVRAPIVNEFNAANSNVANTLALAQSGGNINSGTNQFFFNTANNAGSLDPQKFTVFGRVDDAVSQAILAALAATPTLDITTAAQGSSGAAVLAANPTSLLNAFPIRNYTGTASTFPAGATRDNYVVISGIAETKVDERLSYTAASSNTGLVTATVNGSQLTLTYVAGQTGTATITVTAKDKLGISTSQTFTVNVGVAAANNPPTVAAAIGDQTVAANSANTTIALGNKFADADAGDTLTYTATSSNTATATATVSGGNLVLSYPADHAGTSTITVTATDSHNASVSQTFKVTVTAPANVAPTVAQQIANQTVLQNAGPTTVSLAGKFADANTPYGDTLTYTATSSDDGVAMVAVTGDQLTLTYPAGQTGTATITVTAADSQGLTVSQTFTAHVTANTPPAVGTQIADVTVLQDATPTTVTLAGAFTDPDLGNGDTLTYTAASSDPTKVAVAVAGDSLTLTYAAGASGVVTVTVTATDSASQTATQTFTVDVRPDSAPTVAAQIADQTVVQNAAPATIALAGKFADADTPLGDTLTYTATSSDDAVATVAVNGGQLTVTYSAQTGTATITVTATDTHGQTASQTFTATVQPNTAPAVGTLVADRTVLQDSPADAIDLADKFTDPDTAIGDQLTYTASSTNAGVVTATVSNGQLTLGYVAGQTGQVTISVTATDRSGATANQTFQVTVQADTAPTVATAIGDRTVTQGAAAETIGLADKFADADTSLGDTLTYTASSDNGAVVGAAVSNGQLTLTYGGTGTAAVTVTATDHAGQHVSQTVNVTVNPAANNPPTVASQIPDSSVPRLSPNTTVALADKFADPDAGDTLTYAATSSDTGVVTVSVSGSTLTLGYASGTPGSSTITVTATDSHGAFVSQTFTATVQPNAAPVVAAQIPDKNVDQLSGPQAVTLDDKFSDPDGDALTYAATSSNTNVVVTSVTGNLLYLVFTPGNTGTATVTVTATDPSNATVTQHFLVNVT